MPQKVLKIILRQIDDAKSDLGQYQPDTINWTSRAKEAARKIVPWLCREAPALKSFAEDVLNAPVQLRRMWSQIRPHGDLPREQIEAFDRQLTFDDVLRESVTGEVISKVVAKFLLDHNSDFQCNSRSDYPDLFLGSADYTSLPNHRRGHDAVYGAALKGTPRRPARVPDGLEIKTCRGQIRVDCHHPHPGLHLALIVGEIDRVFVVTDIRLAFLRLADYREAARNTTATTVKYSFGGDRFVSVL